MNQIQPDKGRVMTYNASTGKGIVSVNGQKIDFSLENWETDVVPFVGMTVQVLGMNGEKVSLVPVHDVDVLKEKISDFGNKISSDGLDGAKDAAGKFASAVGIPILAGYGLFLLGTVGLNFITVKMIGTGANLYDFLSQTAALTGSSMGKILLWLSYLSIAVPFLWKDKRASLAYAMPAIAMVMVFYKIFSVVHQAEQNMAGMLGSNNLPSFSDYVSLGAGFYIAFVSSVALAFMGFVKFRKIQ